MHNYETNMENLHDKLPDHYVYSHPVIEFMTVVAQTCKLLEHTNEYEQEVYIETLLKILPLLYQKTIMLHQPEEEIDGFLEQFVTEDDYNEIAGMIKNMLGEDDAYLEVFHADMQLSDTPILAFISENLADIYQELKDGTWKCEDTVYPYRLELSGTLPNARVDSHYVVLSQREDVTFEEVSQWMLSSVTPFDSVDYVLVEWK